ncbi:MAG: hypothetical protein ACYC6C_00540 [Coriobacteriia bacterium]
MRIAITLVIVLALILGVASAAVAAEHDSTGRYYGEHIAEHAGMGHFGPGMYPGMHQGFAGFDEHHDHEDL